MAENDNLQELILDICLDNESKSGLLSDLDKDEEDKLQFQWQQGNFKAKDWDLQNKF